MSMAVLILLLLALLRLLPDELLDVGTGDKTVFLVG